MEKYTIEWKAEPETYYARHTAATKYTADGFEIWKGKRYIGYGCIYGANEWHLVRKSDGEYLHSGPSAKECKGALEYYLNTGRTCGSNIVFNDDFTDYTYKRSARSLRAEARRRRK